MSVPQASLDQERNDLQECTSPMMDDPRHLQRELMAAAAEKRLLDVNTTVSPRSSQARGATSTNKSLNEGISSHEANELFRILFGREVSRGILNQWTNQGIVFSNDEETSMGLVQHEGGPCGVLAAIQAHVLKYLLFFPSKSDHVSSGRTVASSKFFVDITSNKFSSVDEETKLSALTKSMCDILFLCGNHTRAVIAHLDVRNQCSEGSATQKNRVTEPENMSMESAHDLQKMLITETCTSRDRALLKLRLMIPIFQCHFGALLFLISALLSRGLDAIQADRDDPTLPLVTAPFGHASQEIVNLLLCGKAVPNVFDGVMDLGSGMSLKGITTTVDVGFLTLLESLNFCKVGQHLKHPRWPIWVVGSESHYTVLFAPETAAQDENEFEQRESHIRKAFDAQDKSGGGGFVGVDDFRQVLREAHIELSPEQLDHLSSSGFVLWSEFWRVISDLDRTKGGLKDPSGLMCTRVFDLYHFNGIAKLDLTCSSHGVDAPAQRPRLTKVEVSVPPKWSFDDYIGPRTPSSNPGPDKSAADVPRMQAPLVDCIRTRWPHAICSWEGDPPSIV